MLFLAEQELLGIVFDRADRPIDFGERLAAVDGERLILAQTRAGEAVEIDGEFLGPHVEIIGELMDRFRRRRDLCEGAFRIAAGEKAVEIGQNTIDLVGRLIELGRKRCHVGDDLLHRVWIDGLHDAIRVIREFRQLG